MATIDFTDYVTEVPASWLNDVDSHVYDDTTSVHTAVAITNVPAGGIAATTVQAAIDELDTEKAPLASPTFTGTVTTAAISGTTGTFSGTATGQVLAFSGGGTSVAGTIYSDTDWGCLIRAKQAAPGQASFGFRDQDATECLKLTKTAATFPGSISGTTITGTSTSSYGVVAEGDTTSPAKAAFRIVPQDAEPTGANSVGDIYVTTAGVLKICTVAGTPGTWTSVGAQV